jgi:hypothetical protein
MASWTSARETCKSAGGDLVTYASAGEQQMVENYFTNSGTIGAQLYWLGYSRPANGQPYTAASPGLTTAAVLGGGASVPQTYSLRPYAHWGWLFYSRLTVASFGCAVARASAKYDYFIGDSLLDQNGYASASDDMKYGWDVAACAELQTFICKIPANSFPCMPPPAPPPPPPTPPSPPFPPARANCAPSNNATFYCDPQSGQCYSVNATATAFPAARQTCEASGGMLVKYTTDSQQFIVEQYFTRQKALPAYYWMGISRQDAGRPFTYNDNTPVQQLASKNPYAHWTWFTHSYSQNPTYSCALVWSDLSYDDYFGTPGDQDQAGSSTNFNTASGSRLKYGWTPYPCSSQYAYICQMPAAGFACNPPPSPPLPPPRPPSPPAPPAPPTCAPPASNNFFCDGASGMCYQYNAASVTQPVARAACVRLGGDLVKYTTGEKQGTVEGYFTGKSLTNGSYWQGITRTGVTGSYRFQDAAMLPSVSAPHMPAAVVSQLAAAVVSQLE